MKNPALKLFIEALHYYLRAMRDRNLLTADDSHIMLIAINGLVKLNAYPYAKALIRLTYSYITAEEYLDFLDKARQHYEAQFLPLPF